MTARPDPSQHPNKRKSAIWKDLVTDYLEIRSHLTRPQKTYLVEELQQAQVKADNIEVHPCFSIQGRTVIVAETEPPQEYWFYCSRKHRIKKLSSEPKAHSARH